ncbi:hypothetical protein [Methylomonas sp. AM2-LC]|jgi:hypothetical protein|uniref:hypothetical protein n=1 Tax=Methylomonas sp. AM2-LC TaxID=3153301 RepID=UPI00326557F3
MSHYLTNKYSLITCLSILLLVTCFQTSAKSVANKKIDLPGKCSNNNKLLIFDTTFAASQSGDNNFEKGIYIFTLSCRLGSWSLSLFSMNECHVNEGGVKSFEPSLVGWYDLYGQVEAKQIDDNKFKITVYQAENKQLPANILLTFDQNIQPFKNLESIELSGFIDQNALPDRVIPVDYLPLLHNRYKNPDCPILLRGID